jgi:hypothetical protein
LIFEAIKKILERE